MKVKSYILTFIESLNLILLLFIFISFTLPYNINNINSTKLVF